MDLGDVVKGLAEQILEYQGKVALAHGAKGTKQKKVTTANQQKGTQQKNGLVFGVKPKQVSAFDWMQQQMAKNAKELAEEYLQRQSNQAGKKQQQQQQQPKQQEKKQMTLEDVSGAVLGSRVSQPNLARGLAVNQKISDAFNLKPAPTLEDVSGAVLGSRVSQANREKGLAANQELSDEFSLKSAPTLEEAYGAVSNARISPQRREWIDEQNEILEQKDKDYAAGMTYGAEYIQNLLRANIDSSTQLTNEDALRIISGAKKRIPQILPEGVVYEDEYVKGYLRALNNMDAEIRQDSLKKSDAVKAQGNVFNQQRARAKEQGEDVMEEIFDELAAGEYADFDLQSPDKQVVLQAAKDKIWEEYGESKGDAFFDGAEKWLRENSIYALKFNGGNVTYDSHLFSDWLEQRGNLPDFLESYIGLPDGEVIWRISAGLNGTTIKRSDFPEDIWQKWEELQLADASYKAANSAAMADFYAFGAGFLDALTWGGAMPKEGAGKALLDQVQGASPVATSLGSLTGSAVQGVVPGPEDLVITGIGKGLSKALPEAGAALSKDFAEMTGRDWMIRSGAAGTAGSIVGLGEGAVRGDDWETQLENIPINFTGGVSGGLDRKPIEISQQSSINEQEEDGTVLAGLFNMLGAKPTMATELPPESKQPIQVQPVEQGLANAAIDVANTQQKGWSAPVYMDSARKHLPKDNREAAKTFTIGKTLDLPVELSSQLPEGVDAITRNGKIYVSSTADDPAKGVFREYLARELHLPEGSSEILNPYLNDIPTIEKVWREAPELGIVIFQEIDGLRKQLKKQGSFFDDFLQPIQLMHYFYGQIEQEKRKYQKKA